MAKGRDLITTLDLFLMIRSGQLSVDLFYRITIKLCAFLLMIDKKVGTHLGTDRMEDVI